MRTWTGRAAGWGVPAHVTVLYPFLPPDRIDDGALTALAAAIRSVPAFDLVLPRTAWFDDSVLWLAPEPDQTVPGPGARQSGRGSRLPALRRGYADVIPHLTVGHDAPVAVLRAAEARIEPQLPVHARVRAARLIRGSAEPGSMAHRRRAAARRRRRERRRRLAGDQVAAAEARQAGHGQRRYCGEHQQRGRGERRPGSAGRG